MKTWDWITSMLRSQSYPYVALLELLPATHDSDICPLNSRYIELVKKHGLEISQPGLEPNDKMAWRMTERRADSEVHK